jgi:hypothetical protein
MCTYEQCSRVRMNGVLGPLFIFIFQKKLFFLVVIILGNFLMVIILGNF